MTRDEWFKENFKKLEEFFIAYFGCPAALIMFICFFISPFFDIQFFAIIVIGSLISIPLIIMYSFALIYFIFDNFCYIYNKIKTNIRGKHNDLQRVFKRK